MTQSLSSHTQCFLHRHFWLFNPKPLHLAEGVSHLVIGSVPDLCGESLSSQGNSSPRWHPDTSSAWCPSTKSPSWRAGNRTGSHSPCTQIPDTGGNVGCTRRRAERASDETVSCWRSQTHTCTHTCFSWTVKCSPNERTEGWDLSVLTSWPWPLLWIRRLTCTLHVSSSPPPSSCSIFLLAPARTGQSPTPDPRSVQQG